MPSQELLASAGLARWPERGYAVGWWNASGGAAGADDPIPDGNGDDVRFVLRACSIGGLFDPASVGSDCAHRVYNWDKSAAYFTITPGVSPNTSHCVTWPVNVRVNDGLQAGTPGALELVFNCLVEPV